MIPNAIFNFVSNTENAVSGATLKLSNKSYHLGSDDNGRIVCTKHAHADTSEKMHRLLDTGYETVHGWESCFERTGRRPSAWKEISLKNIPNSNEGDWETYDER